MTSLSPRSNTSLPIRTSSISPMPFQKSLDIKHISLKKISICTTPHYVLPITSDACFGSVKRRRADQRRHTALSPMTLHASSSPVCALSPIGMSPLSWSTASNASHGSAVNTTTTDDDEAEYTPTSEVEVEVEVVLSPVSPLSIKSKYNSRYMSFPKVDNSPSQHVVSSHQRPCSKYIPAESLITYEGMETENGDVDDPATAFKQRVTSLLNQRSSHQRNTSQSSIKSLGTKDEQLAWLCKHIL